MIYDNTPLGTILPKHVFELSDVWFIETTDSGDLKIVTREDEDTHLFRGSCSILFQSKTITVR